MDRQEAKKALQDILYEDYVFSEEYQDKYFLAKEIMEKLPEFKEPRVYEAINFANTQVKHPRMTHKFIDAFLKKALE